MDEEYVHTTDADYSNLATLAEIRAVLVGKRIYAVRHVQDSDFPSELEIEYVCEDGNHYLRISAEGDCCSVGWFDRIENPDALIGHVVTSVDMITVSEITDGRNRKDPRNSDAVYSIKIRTDAGDTAIEFRNSSDGYQYGTYIKISKRGEAWDK